VTLDGREWPVDAVRVDAHTWSLLVGRASFEVHLRSQPMGQMAVQVGNAPMEATLNGRRRSNRKEEGGLSGSAPNRIVAPMPGKVVRVLVRAGDSVHARQPVVVIEAMKMENELRAGRDGTVSDVPARAGQSVDAGALLALIV
jgi:biotin carboxyl carrier protein